MRSLEPKPEKDQHLLTDTDVIEQMVEALAIMPSDVVVEIGAGTGNITALMPHCLLHLIEKDERFVEVLRKEFPHALIHAGDAQEILPKLFDADVKLIGNLPFQIAESLMQMLCRNSYAMGSFILPSALGDSLRNKQPYRSVMSVELFPVEPSAFYPVPRTSLCLCIVRRKLQGETPLERCVQELLFQEDKLLKNALREALCRVIGKTKNEAREMAEKILPAGTADRTLRSLSNAQFEELATKFEDALK